MGLARGRGRGRGVLLKPRGRGSPLKPPPLMGRLAPPPGIGLRPRGLPVPPLLPRMRPPPPGMRSPRLLPPPPHPMMGGPPRPPLPPFHPPPPHLGHRLPPPLPPRPPVPPPSLLRARGQRLPPVMPGMRAPGFRPLGGPIHPMMTRFGPGKRGGNSHIQRGAKRKPKAKRPENVEDTEMNKPWVTEAMKNEIQKKHKLYQKAKKSNEQPDWEEFKEQRNRVTTMIREAKLEYIGSHPEEAEEYYCDMCDREFKHADKLAEHVSQHTTCGLDGCRFTAHPKVVAKHVEMQHNTGLFKKIGRLSTPEDIAKWIADRKRNYPTKENIVRRHQAREERLKRGERIEKDKSRFNRDAPHFGWPGRNRNRRGRGHRNVEGRVHTVRRVRKQTYFQTEEDEEEDKQVNWRGNLPPFLGIASISEEEEPVEQEDEDQRDLGDLGDQEDLEDQHFTDTEWENSTSSAQLKSSTVVTSGFSRALNNLMGLYASDQSNSEDDGPPPEVPVLQPSVAQLPDPVETNLTTTSTGDLSFENASVASEQCKDLIKSEINLELNGSLTTNSQPPMSENESGPEEVKILHKDPCVINVPVTIMDQQQVAHETTHDNSGNSRKRRRHHKQKKNSHVKDSSAGTSNDAAFKGTVRKPVVQPYFPKQRITLLQKLLTREIRHERNAILQCVRYVIQNKFFGIGQSSKLVIEPSKRENCNKETQTPLQDVDCMVGEVNYSTLHECIHYIVGQNFFGLDR